MTDCRTMADRLSAFLDGELAAEQCAAIRAHIAECRSCRAFAASLEWTVALCRALPRRRVPEPLAREIATLLERLRDRG